MLLLSILSAVTCFAQYHVYYNGNGNDGGNVPVDTNTYSPNEMVMVQWEAPLTNTGYVFSCWNTMSDGSGINYSPDAYSSGPTLQMGNSDITLYAQWGSCSQPTGNYALNFNEGQFMGNDDTFESVLVEDLPPFSNEMTIEFWINPSTFDSIEEHNNPVILKFYTEDVYIGLKYDGGQHILSWNGWDACGVTDIPANQWTHIAIVLNNNTLEAMYINGISENFSLGGNPISLPSSDEWVIGNMTWSSSPYRWHGMIDEIRIWNTARTANQISDFYNKELNGNEQGLYIYWNFNKSSNTQLLCDQNLNGNNHVGVLRNMENSDWVSGAPLSPLGVNEISNNQFIILPIPATDFIEIYSENEIQNLKYKIITCTGNTVKRGTVSNKKEQISISNLNTGMYFIQLFFNNKITTSKIIKR